jgi:hypothetical protein
MAGQDYKRTIPAGGSTRINANGETYLFCKFTDRDITVDIAGRKVVMRAGSYMEFAPLRGENSHITIYNEDTDNPVYIILTLGVGTYDEKIVRGEITVLPGVRKANGQWVDDTRWDLQAAVTFTDWQKINYQKNELLEELNTNSSVIGFGVYPKENAVVYKQSNAQIIRYELDTGQKTTLQASGAWYEIGDYRIEDLTTTIDRQGNAWLAGYNKHDATAGFIPVNSDLEINGQIEKVNALMSRGYAGRRLTSGDKLFYVVITRPTISANYQNGIEIYEKTNDKLVLRKQMPKGAYNFTGATIQNEKLVIEWAHPTNKTAAIFDLESFSTDEISGTVITPGASGSLIIDAGNRVAWKTTISSVIASVSAMQWQQTGRGVFTTCASGFMFKPEQRRTDAGIVTSDDGEGRVMVRGQIIRAMLDLYLGGFVADDYLDHVYSVTFDNEGGRSPRTITAGNTTFAGAKIEDNFTAIFPQSVTITIDNGLTIKG